MDKNKNKEKIRNNFFMITTLVLLAILGYVFYTMVKINKLEKEVGNIKVEKEKNKENSEKNIDENKEEKDENENEIEKEEAENDSENNSENNSEIVKKMKVKIPTFNDGNISFVKHDVKKSPKILNATLEKLFNLRSVNNNRWNNLKFLNATLKNKKATVRLVGTGNSLTTKQKKEIVAATIQFPTIENVDIMINNNIVFSSQNNDGNGAGAPVVQNSNWTPCNGLFPYVGNQGNSTFIDTEMAALAYTTGNQVQVSNGYKIRGCIRQISGTYDSWGPFEGVIGTYQIKKQDGTILTSGALYGHKMPGSIATELNYAASAGENMWFEETVNYNFSAVSGQAGSIVIHNDNASGMASHDRVKIYPIIFQ